MDRMYILRSSGGMENAGGGGAGGTGGPGGGGGNPAGGEAAAAAAAEAARIATAGNPANPAPWGDVNNEWKIGEKPWYEAVVPEGKARDHVKAKGYKNPTQLAEANYQLTQLATDPNRIAIPGPDADDKTQEAFTAKLRGPIDAPDKYDIKIDPAVKVDPNLLSFGKNLAFKLGLDGKRAQTMVDEWNKMTAGMNGEVLTQQAAANDKAIGDMQTSLGAKFDEYKTAGKRAFDALKNNPKVAALKMTNEDFDAVERSIGAAPMLKLLAAIGSLTNEADFVTGASGGAAPGSPEAMTAEQAATEITKLRGDEAFQKKFMDAAHPEHKEAVDRMNRLYAKAGNKAAV